MEHKYLISKRGTVHYWIKRNSCENAKCIVFTHGLCANHTMFEKQTQYFSKKYTVIVWDVPMHGLSRPYTDFSYENTAKELKEILARENINKVILTGMSMGGYPSQQFASMYPEMVTAFIALDTTPFGIAYYSRSDKWWLTKAGSIAKLYPDKMLRKMMAKSVSKTQCAYNLMLDMLKALKKDDIAKQMNIAYSCFVRENKDVKFNFPVLILLGEYDKTGKVKQYCTEWSKREGYPLKIIKNAAHLSNADNYEDVNREIESFISDL